jgi:hypothetical protein
MYQPCAKRMRSMKMTSSAPVPIHLYVVYGVTWSRRDWYLCKHTQATVSNEHTANKMGEEEQNKKGRKGARFAARVENSRGKRRRDKGGRELDTWAIREVWTAKTWATPSGGGSSSLDIIAGQAGRQRQRCG